ncbi:hypothetical protein [Schleiferia thermophila]|nr:hypothetical protein [Schleiferia thermophila]KFD38727.1 hypothetical protein AT05_08785 [Schleiferia thermophila str. Yellowstone]
MLLFFSINVLSVVMIGCREQRQHQVPNVPVDEVIFLNLPSSLPLQAPGGWIYHPGGFRGLLIYRAFFNGNADDFRAFDRTCPSHINEPCGLVHVSDDNIISRCGCDSAGYILFDGTPEAGNQSLPLKQYRVQFFGNSIRVFN